MELEKKITRQMSTTILFLSFILSQIIFATNSLEISETKRRKSIPMEDKEKKDLSFREKRMLHKVGRKARRALHFRKLKKFIRCAHNLTESQYKGSESPLFALDLLNKLSQRILKENYYFKDLYKQCNTKLKKYKDREEPRTRLSDTDSKTYIEDVKKLYPDNKNILLIAKKELNQPKTSRRNRSKFSESYLFNLLHIPKEVLY